MKPRFSITIGALFVLSGLLLGSDNIIQFAKANYSKPVSWSVVSETKAAAVSRPTDTIDTTPPTSVTVPSVDVSVDIIAGYYNSSDGTWTQSDDKASFATVTSVPNAKSGNLYVYGHNRFNVFAKLNNLTIGDKAYVTNQVGKVFVYKLVSIRDVQPDDLSLLQYTGKPILTLQTCSGAWDQYRRLFIFNFESEG